MNSDTVVIVNPRSGRALAQTELDSVKVALGDARIEMTQATGDARRWASEAVAGGAERIVVAGGDGTINEVLEGIAPDFEKVSLGILPFGTGNDLTRSLGIPFDAELALELIMSGHTTPVDVVRLTTDTETRHFLNASAGGFGGKVGDAMSSADKSFWGPFSYLKTALVTLTEITSYPCQARLDEQQIESDLINFVVANGRTLAGGLSIAPWAEVSDGRLEFVGIPTMTINEMAIEAPMILSGAHRESERLVIRSCERIQLSFLPPILANIDGEMLKESRSFDYQILPSTIRIFTPPPA